MWRSSSGLSVIAGVSPALADFTGEELAELNQVRTVALDGVIAEVFLELQIVEKLAERGV